MFEEEFHRLELSLKEYLMDEQSDSYTSHNANLYKYNNLRIYMEPSRTKVPHLIIRVGISEAMYDLDKNKKLSGGLGSDESLVRRWLERYSKLFDLDGAWKQAIKPKDVILRKDLGD